VGATPQGRDLAPRISRRLDLGLTADCTQLGIDREEGGRLLQTRPAFGGNIMATIVCPSRRPQMATVRPRVMKIAAPDESRAGEVIRVDDAGPIEIRTRLVEAVREVSDKVDLAGAEVIVTGGRGLGNAEGFDLMRRLAERLGGVVGATRGAVDNGWIDYAHQVGQTGRTVAPRLYIACGVSGAVQHLVGMQSSDVIVAVNSDAQAPIFGVATYGIVGDLHQVVPAMLTELGAD
jgi:electron transfer flavoprotein alpha subunit